MNLAVRYAIAEHPELTGDAVSAACDVLRQGGLVLFPTETVYGIGCDAMNPSAVSLLYERKKRPPEKALLLHLYSREQAEKAAVLTPEAERLLDAFCPGPLSLILPKRDIVSDAVSAGSPTVGLRFPSDPFFRRMAAEFGGFIAATSANLSGLSSARDSGELQQAEFLADLVVDAGPCRYSFESTILSLAGPRPVLLRKGVIGRQKIEEVLGTCITSD